MTALLITALALAGVLIGRLQRAVIWRYSVPAGESPRTCCPECETDVGTWSRLARLAQRLTDRCPGCRVRSGPPPATVELTAAAALGLLAARVHPGLVLAATAYLAIWAVPLGYIDAAVRRLPRALTGPAYVGTLLLLTLAAAVGGQWPALARAALGGLALVASYGIIALISPSAVGGGDIRLAASIGTALAWFGWASLLAGVLAGFLIAACYGLALLATRRASLGQQIPFGPFMIAGAALVILAGSR